MSLFVRKIELAKWQKSEFLDKGEIPADAITKCLSTSFDNLSVWEIESESEIDDIALAIYSIPQRDKIEKMDIVILDPDYLLKSGIISGQTDGATLFEARKKSHRDLLKLSNKTLDIVAYHIVDNLKKDKFKQYPKGRIKELLKQAILDNGKIALESLHEKLQEAIRS
jgi:hypothetical protein